MFNDLTEAHTLFLCELSEGLAFKYFVIRHLNQAHRQYVDSDALAVLRQQLLPFDFDWYHTLMFVGCQGFWRNEPRRREGREGKKLERDFSLVMIRG